MDKESHTQLNLEWIYLYIPNFNGLNVGVWNEQKIIPYLEMDTITYPCWDYM